MATMISRSGSRSKQPRWPKGDTRGGQFRGSGGGEVAAGPGSGDSARLAQAVDSYETRIRDEPIEHGVMFAADGRVLSENVGDVDSVVMDIPDEPIAVHMHNHPSNYGSGQTTAPSPTDISAWGHPSLTATQEFRVTGATHSYSIKPNRDRGWGNQRAYERLSDEAMNRLQSTGLVGFPFEASNSFWAYVGPRMGWNVTRTERATGRKHTFTFDDPGLGSSPFERGGSE